MDRELPDTNRRNARLRAAARIALPTAAVVAVLVLLPGWMRPAIARVDVRTAVVQAGPIEAVVTAAGTVMPAVERILSSPVDARLLRVLKRPGASVVPGEPIAELDLTDTQLAIDRVARDLAISRNKQDQARLTLDKSLADVDARIERKALDLELLEARAAAAARLADARLASAHEVREARLAAQAAAIDLAQLRHERDGARKSTALQAEGLSLEYAALEKEAAAARRTMDLATTRSDRDGIVTWTLTQRRRSRPPRRGYRADCRSPVCPNRRDDLGHPQRPDPCRHAGQRVGQRGDTRRDDRRGLAGGRSGRDPVYGGAPRALAPETAAEHARGRPRGHGPAPPRADGAAGAVRHRPRTGARHSSLLTSSLAYGAELADGSRTDFERAITIVIERTERLNRFMRSFADVFRLPVPVKRPERIVDLVESCAALVSARSDATPLEWQWDIDRRDLTVPIDRNQMEQVLLNVLQNAVDATGGRGTIGIRLQSTGVSRPSLFIEDSGPGLAPEAQANLFTPFFSTKPHGQGIGLTLTREILTGHGFDYALERPPGGPTRFTIVF